MSFFTMHTTVILPMVFLPLCQSAFVCKPIYFPSTDKQMCFRKTKKGTFVRKCLKDNKYCRIKVNLLERQSFLHISLGTLDLQGFFSRHWIEIANLLLLSSTTVHQESLKERGCLSEKGEVLVDGGGKNSKLFFKAVQAFDCGVSKYGF